MTTTLSEVSEKYALHGYSNSVVLSIGFYPIIPMNIISLGIYITQLTEKKDKDSTVCRFCTIL